MQPMCGGCGHCMLQPDDMHEHEHLDLELVGVDIAETLARNESQDMRLHALCYAEYDGERERMHLLVHALWRRLRAVTRCCRLGVCCGDLLRLPGVANFYPADRRGRSRKGGCPVPSLHDPMEPQCGGCSSSPSFDEAAQADICQKASKRMHYLQVGPWLSRLYYAAISKLARCRSTCHACWTAPLWPSELVQRRGSTRWSRMATISGKPCLKSMKNSGPHPRDGCEVRN